MARFLSVLSILLAAGGLFISLTLSLAHTNGAVLPCGAGAGCETVANDPRSMFLGFPVAYYGVAAYFVLLASFIASLPAARTVGLILTFAGTLVSGFLIYESLIVIHASCLWCLSSAAIMAALLLIQTVRQRPNLFDRGGLGMRAGLGLVLAGSAVAGAIGIEQHSRRDNVNRAAVARLTLRDLEDSASHTEGPADAPVTLVEFADYACPACRNIYPGLKKALRDSNRIRLVYHHFPLTYVHGHEASGLGAICSEIAGEQGLFWQYSDLAFNGPDHPSVADYKAILVKVGVKGDVSKRLADPADPAAKRVEFDHALGARLGIYVTPVFVVFSPDLGPIATTNVDLLDALKRKEIQSYLR